MFIFRLPCYARHAAMLRHVTLRRYYYADVASAVCHDITPPRLLILPPLFADAAVASYTLAPTLQRACRLRYAMTCAIYTMLISAMMRAPPTARFIVAKCYTRY